MSRPHRIHVVTTVTGNSYVAFLRPFLASVRQHHSDAAVIVYHKDLTPDRIRGLQVQFPNVDFRHQGIEVREEKHEVIGGKLRFFVDALRGLDEAAPVLFIDCDTLLVRPVTTIFDREDFDVCFTWKEDGFPLNSGVMPARNTDALKAFLREWNAHTQAILANSAEEAMARQAFGAADQLALAQLVCRGAVMEADKASDLDRRTAAYDGAYVSDRSGNPLRLLGVNCRLLNETRCVPIDEQTHVIHYKSGWHRILLHGEPFHPNRPEAACREMRAFWERHRQEASRQWADMLLAGVDDGAAADVARVAGDHCDRGMLNSELLLVYWLVRTLGVERVVESGRWLGHSTLTLSRLFEGTSVMIDSVDYSRTAASRECERRLAGRRNVRLHYGDAFKVLPEIIGRDSASAILLVDGPKGAEAVHLIAACFRTFGHVAAAFLHDASCGSAARAAVEDTVAARAFTDDPTFVRRFHALDGGIDVGGIHLDQFHGNWERSLLPPEGRNAPPHDGPRSYGPTLAMMLPDKAVVRPQGLAQWRERASRKVRYAMGSMEATLRSCKRTLLGG